MPNRFLHEHSDCYVGYHVAKLVIQEAAYYLGDVLVYIVKNN